VLTLLLNKGYNAKAKKSSGGSSAAAIAK